MFNKISKFFLSKGYKTTILYRSSDESTIFSENFFSHYKSADHYGFEYYNDKILKNEFSYIKEKIRFVKILNRLKSDLLFKIDNIKPDLILSPDSYDIALNIITKYRKNIPVYFLQHSNILSTLKPTTLRQKYYNILTSLFCGFKINRSLNYAPFNNVNIIYLLWSKEWTKNVDTKKFKIEYVPHIIKRENKIANISRKKIKNVLIILNKRKNIGAQKWGIFKKFYEKFALNNLNYNLVFKCHPSENFSEINALLQKYKVVKSDINLDDFDLVVSHWSTFIYQVALLRKPLILINPKNKFNYDKWRLSHFPLIVDTPEKLVNTISLIERKKIDINRILSDFLDISLGPDRHISLKILESVLIKKNQAKHKKNVI